MGKVPAPPLAPLRKFQKALLEALGSVGTTVANGAKVATRNVAQRLKKIDEKVHVTEAFTTAGKNIGQAVSSVNQRYEISSRASKLATHAVDNATAAGQVIRHAADEHGVTDALQDRLVTPAREVAHAIEQSKAVRAGLDTVEHAYGATRNALKDVFNPYFTTYDTRELLLATKNELEDVTACIMQISTTESAALASQFRHALASKVAGTATVTGLMALVTTFATAGTGTPIASLAGAAAAKASMAWIGGLVGGGVAAGAALTGGVAIVTGLAAYRALSSERRGFECLTDQEQRLVQTCWLLAALCSELAESTDSISRERMQELYEDALLPLYNELRDNTEALCMPLDRKHAVAFRQHLLRDFGEGVVTRFGQYLTWRYSPQGEEWDLLVRAETSSIASQTPVVDKDRRESEEKKAPYHWPKGLMDGNIEAAVGGAVAALLTQQVLDDSRASELFLLAVRRAAPELANASQSEITHYVRALAERSDDSLRGFGCSVKGIFHEFLWVERYNSTHSDTFARMYESPTHPGADIEFLDRVSGEVLDQAQLKAVAASASVTAHFEVNPSIRVLATDEVARGLEDERVAGSGFSNADLSKQTDDNLSAIHDHTLEHRAGATAATAAIIGSAAEIMQMLRGEREFPDAVLNVAAKTGVAAGTTAVTVLLFG